MKTEIETEFLFQIGSIKRKNSYSEITQKS